MVILFAQPPARWGSWAGVRGRLPSAACAARRGPPVRHARRRARVHACAAAPPEPERLFLVDAMGLVYRGYHALSHATMSSRALRDTRAVYGFALVLLSLGRGHARGAHVAVVFEGASKVRPDFRSEMFPEYKATRPRPPEGIRDAVPWVKRLVRALGFAVVEVPAFEADDVIGTLARSAVESNFAEEVVIVSTDKDFRQLLRNEAPSVKILKPANSRSSAKAKRAAGSASSHEYMGEDDFRADFEGLAPIRYIDVLALLGDKIDNIPGVPGIGSKTAPKLIAQYGSLDELLKAVEEEDVKSLPGVSARFVKLLRENSDIARLSAYLVSIKCDVHIPDFSLNDLRRTSVCREALTRLTEELEFDGSILARMLEVSEGLPEGDLNQKKGRPVRSKARAEEVPEPGVSPQTRGSPKRANSGRSDALRRFSFLPRPKRIQYLSFVPEDFAMHNSSEVPEKTACDTGLQQLLDDCLSASSHRLGIAVIPGKDGKPAGMALSSKPGVALYFGSEEHGIDIPVSVRELLLNNDVTKYGWFLKETQTLLAGRLRGPFFDIRLARDLLYAGENMSDRRFLERYFGDSVIENSQLLGESAKAIEIPRDSGMAHEMADMALRLSEALHTDLELSGVARVAHDIEFPLIPVLSDMERVGVPFSVGGLADVRSKVESEIYSLEEQLLSFVPQKGAPQVILAPECVNDSVGLTGDTPEQGSTSKEAVVAGEGATVKSDNARLKHGKKFSLTSRDDVARLLFDVWEIPVKTKTSGGRPATDKRTLLAIAGNSSLPEAHRAFASLLLKHREASKIASTYTKSLSKAVSADGRIRATFVQDSSASGRLSTSNPNLQSIPSRSVVGKELRATVAPGEGRRIICADYSQIELRILAAMSGDNAMLSAFQCGEDIHASIARGVYRLEDGQTPTAEQRSRAKAVSYGVPYGISAHGLSQQLGVERGAAQALISGFRTAYPRVHALTEVLVSSARECGAAHTLHGRRLALPLLTRGGRSERAAAARVAVNMPIQGTQADMLKLALAGVWHALRDERLDAHIVLAVHDEIVVEAAESDATRARDIIAHEMAYALPLPGVDVAVSIGVGDSWQDAAACASIFEPDRVSSSA